MGTAPGAGLISAGGTDPPGVPNGAPRVRRLCSRTPVPEGGFQAERLSEAGPGSCLYPPGAGGFGEPSASLSALRYLLRAVGLHS